MANPVVEVRFGADHEYLTLSVRGRAYRQPPKQQAKPSKQKQEYWDGNWLLVTATIHVGKFSGEVPGMLRAEEFEAFNQRLNKFQRTLKGLVTFTTMEEWLNFTVEADQSGRIEISGTLSDDVSYPYNTLKFTLTTHPASLTEPLRQLQRVTETFPVVGKP